MKKIVSLALAALVAAGTAVCFTGCGGSKDENTFSWWANAVEGTNIWGNYENSPAMKYILNKEYVPQKRDMDGNIVETLEGTKISLEFESPAGGATPQDSFSTTLSSSPADIMELTYSTDSIETLYDRGIAMDITEYVYAYMPNYLKYLKDNNLFYVSTNEVNGERRFLQLFSYTEEQPYSWLGCCYRRDWLVKYGKDPLSGESFTGSWSSDKVGDKNRIWTDNVVFPSYYYDTDTEAMAAKYPEWNIGSETAEFIADYKEKYTDWKGDYPVTISDWEWMLGYFAEAAKSIEGAYATSLYEPGFINSGNIVSSFGGGGVEWYINKDNTVSFGATESTFEAYINAMRKWYENGWIDKDFQSHSGDLFFSWDSEKIRAGKVGLYMGQDTTLLDNMDISNGNTSDLTYNICVYGAAYPINDVYGTAENKYQDPYCFYEVGGADGVPIMITTEAKDKNLPALFTMLDYMYSKEGSILKGAGLTKEMVDEADVTYYKTTGLANGACYYDENKGYYVFTDEASVLTASEQNNYKSIRLFGLEGYVRYPYERRQDKFIYDLFSRYKNTGFMSSALKGQMSKADSKTYLNTETDIRNYFTKEVPKFIKGDYNMTTDWSKFKANTVRYGTATVTEIFNQVVAKMNEYNQ